MPTQKPRKGFLCYNICMKSKQTLIIGNLKQNPQNLKDAISLTKNYIKLKKENKWINLGIALPYIFLSPAQKELGKSISIYSQAVSTQNSGSHTGEVSAEQINSIGIKHTIIGHSERRAQGETNKKIAEQIQNALNKNMQIVLCVGELERHNDATHIHFVEDQIQTALIDIRKIDSKNITIAYEPVWAIGADAVRGANQNEIYEMTIVIRKKLVDLFGKNSGGEIPIIYGGSVNSQNAKEIMSVHHIDGMLLGRASLDINEMKKIINQIKR